jgi:hypothetical protein
VWIKSDIHQSPEKKADETHWKKKKKKKKENSEIMKISTFLAALALTAVARGEPSCCLAPQMAADHEALITFAPHVGNSTRAT